MKKIVFLLAFVIIISITGYTQVAINTDGNSPNSSAMLDVQSSDKGMLIPRMTEAERDAISSPLTGLMVFQTDNTTGFYYYDGSNWKVIGSDAFSINDLSDGKTGGNSVFLGENAGTNEDGIDRKNVAIGRAALWSDTSGHINVAVGYSTLYKNKSGDYNTAVGAYAMWDNTIGGYNTSTGYSSLFFNIEGNGNTANGVVALQQNTTGNENTAMGASASRQNSTGSNNVAIGAGANKNNEEGSDNTIIGHDAGAGAALHNKSGNVFLGYSAGYNESGDNKLYIENSNSATPLIYGEFDNDIIKINGDLEVTGSLTGIGIDDLSDGKTGGYSVFLGENAGINDDGTINFNVAVGDYALGSNIDGTDNSAIGYGALYEGVSGSQNIAVGIDAGYSNIGNGNIFLGYKAGYNETGDNKLYIENSNSTTPLIYGEFDNDILAVNGNLGVGTQTPGVKLQVVGGTDAILSGGGYLVTGPTTGQNIVMDENEIMARDNGAISAIHLQRDGGAFNLHYGLTESHEFVVATDGKTGIGENSPTAKLHINATPIEDGLRVQINGATELKVCSNGGVAVGYNPTSPTFALQLQNSSVDIEGRARAYSWNTYSDGRLKTNQQVLDYGLKEVMLLQPKSYFHHDSETKEDGTFVMVGSHKTHTFGFIAQELNQIIPEAVYVPKDETKDLWSIDYEKLIPVLTKAIQQQQQIITETQKENTSVKQDLAEMQEQVSKLLQRIDKLENNR